LNKTIADKKIIFTNFVKKFEDIKTSIKNKQDQALIESKSNLTTHAAEKVNSDLKQTKEENASIIEFVVKTEQILKQVFLYVKKYDKSLDNVMINSNIFIKKSNTHPVEPDEYIEIKEVQNWNYLDGII